MLRPYEERARGRQGCRRYQRKAKTHTQIRSVVHWAVGRGAEHEEKLSSGTEAFLMAGCYAGLIAPAS